MNDSPAEPQDATAALPDADRVVVVGPNGQPMGTVDLNRKTEERIP